MNGPSQDLRNRIADELEGLPGASNRGPEHEQVAERLLEQIAAEAESDVEVDLESITDLSQVAVAGEPPSRDQLSTAEALLVTVNEWASVLSYVSSAVYGPASPMPRRLVGWGNKALTHIQSAAKVLLKPLAAAASVTGASSWSISVGFPWGISVGLSWP